MKRVFKVFALCAIVFAAVSCGKSRTEQMALAADVKISCEPEVLTLVGDKVDAEITIVYPEKYFYPKTILEVTPVLVYEGGEVAGKTFTYQGEKVKDNYEVVSYDGGTVTEKVSFDYVDGMETSYLELRGVLSYKDTEVELPALKVADGCNVTQLLADNGGIVSFKKDNYQEVLHESTEGQILYTVNSSVVRNSELKSESVKDLQAALEEVASDPRYTVTGTKIISYASPEGGQELNAKLSDRRAESAEKAWDKVTGGMPAGDVQVQSVGQDWEGFQEAVENSNVEDKDLILRVLSMYSDPAVREREIRNMSQVYQEISKDVFPELRRARFIADLDYRNFSDAELVELTRSAIEVLDEEALLRAASVVSDKAAKAEIYKEAVTRFSSDRANFNLAVLALQDRRPDEAAGYLSAIRNPDADVTNAKGVCEFQKGNYAAAAELFSKAGTEDAKANLGAVQILQGDYDAAVKTLADTDSDVKAVAYILTGDLDKAEAAVTCDCPRANYLRAVIAAREGDSDAVASNLNKVAAASPELMAKAEKDVEFANYR